MQTVGGQFVAHRVASASLTVATTESCHRIAAHRIVCRAQCKQTDEWGNRLARRRQRSSSVTTLRMSLLAIPISIAQPIPIAQHSKAQQRKAFVVCCVQSVCVCVSARCVYARCACVCVSVPPHRVAFCCLSMKKKKFRRRCWRRLRCSPPWLVDGAATLRMRSVSRRESRWMQHSALTHGADQTRFRALLSRFAIVCAFASSCATQSNIATTTITATIIPTTITATRDNEDNQVCPLCVQRATCVSRVCNVSFFCWACSPFFFVSQYFCCYHLCVCNIVSRTTTTVATHNACNVQRATHNHTAAAATNSNCFRKSPHTHILFVSIASKLPVSPASPLARRALPCAVRSPPLWSVAKVSALAAARCPKSGPAPNRQ